MTNNFIEHMYRDINCIQMEIKFMSIFFICISKIIAFWFGVFSDIYIPCDLTNDIYIYIKSFKIKNWHDNIAKKYCM